MEIKVLHVNNTDVIGGRFNGYALNRQLPQVGVHSELAVWNKDSKDDLTWQIASDPRWFKLNDFIQRVERRLSLQALLHFGSWFLLFDKRLRRSNVLHFHLLHNHFFSLFSLPFLTRLRPTVWTVHDTWAVTGRCVQPLGCEGWRKNCGVCPDVTTHMWTRVDRSRFAFRIKRVMYALSRFEVIVASEYMKRMVDQSPLMKGKKVHLVPFGLDTQKFRPTSKQEARRRFGIADDAFVLSFRINGGPYKGAAYLQEMLRRLKSDQPVVIIAVELKGMLEEFKTQYQIVEFDWIDDESLLVDIYNASDLFLMPSLAEAFGMMAIEAMACGKPIIVFEGTALPGVVDAPRVGISVPRDSEALTHAVEEFICKPAMVEERGRLSREWALQRYSTDRYLANLKSVYSGVLRKWGRRKI